MPALLPLPAFLQSLKATFRPPYRHTAHFERVLGTTLELQVLAGDRAQTLHAQQALLAEIDRLELVFSRFLPHSELNRWLAQAVGEPVPVSPELGRVLEQALDWTRLSGGAFHPATEALSPLWKEAEASGRLPDTLPVLEQLRRPLYTVMQDHGRWSATRLSPLPLGFNAFAKGFIADHAAAAALAAPGVTQVLVNLGGDLRCLGPQPVRVAIADPFTRADNAAPIGSVQVQGQGVATSGRARRGFRVAGQWYSHVLDPRSGQPAGEVVSASVVAPDSATADVLATIFSVLSPSESLRLADDLPGVACLLVSRTGQVDRNTLWTGLELDPPPSFLNTAEDFHDQNPE